MTQELFYKNLIHFAQEDIIETSHQLDMMAIYIKPSSLIRLLTILRDHRQFQFCQLVDIFAVDYPQKKERFEVIYHFLSHANNKRLFIKLKIQENQQIPTITDVFPNANWYEREIFDLMGVYFSDHPDLRRILTDYHFDGHPLRKDFPLSGYSQTYYNEKEQKVDSEPVMLEQNYRDFDFVSNWEASLHKFKE